MAVQDRRAQRRVRSLKRKIKKSKRRGWQKALLLLSAAVLVMFGLHGPGQVGHIEEPGQTEEQENVPAGTTGQLTVHFLDVGQADCTLLETQGKYMLIDAGNREDFAAIDGYLQGEGVTRLEMVWLTHPHEDHIGSAAQLLERYDVGAVYMRTEDFDTNLYADLQAAVREKVIPMVAPQAGTEVAFGDCRIRVLGPITTSEHMNDNSLILKVSYGNTKFLFTGDAERDEEQEVLESGADVRADVLKVGHHGSETSTSYYFLRQVWPKYAVISVGAGNDYGHPHEEVLSRLEDAEVFVYRTDELGTIVAVSDGNRVTFPGID